MSPLIFKSGPYRYFFFSREERRMHVHVAGNDGEAKFWLEPIISLANSYGLNRKELIKIQKVIEDNETKIKKSWKSHFHS